MIPEGLPGEDDFTVLWSLALKQELEFADFTSVVLQLERVPVMSIGHVHWKETAALNEEAMKLFIFLDVLL